MKKTEKVKYWILKVLSIIISCGFPIFAVLEHFPIWSVEFGAKRTVGAGGIICLIVLVVVFRKTVFDFVRDKLKLRHAPPIAVWIIMLIVAYVLTYINIFIQDLTTVFWMGLLGCSIGTVLTWIAESKFGSAEENDDGQS